MTTVLGILGGIGSGKSTVSGHLRDLGAVVLDADVEAHAVLSRPDIVERVAVILGSEVLDQDGRVSRPRVAERVFDDVEALRALEGIVHPEVRATLMGKLDSARADRRPMVVLDIPLLLSSPFREQCDKLLFVKCSSATRRRRIAARGWDDDELARRERRQTPLAEKEAAADFVVENDGDMSVLRSTIESIFLRLTRGHGESRHGEGRQEESGQEKGGGASGHR